MNRNVGLIVAALIVLVAVGAVLSANRKNGTNGAATASPTESATSNLDASTAVPTDTPSSSASATASATSTQSKVTISSFAFDPGTITVKKGTTVTWTNQDSVGHTVTGDNGGPDSGVFANGETYSFTFNTTGTFKYHCKVHPSMTGTVIVTE